MTIRCGWRRALGVVGAASFLLVVACAGTRRNSAPVPFSRSTSVWQTWDAEGRPYYEITLRLPWPELQARRESGDPQIRLIATAGIGAPDGNVRQSRSWTRQLERAAWRSEGEFEWSLLLDTEPGEQELSLTVLAQGRPVDSPWRRVFVVAAIPADSLLIAEPVFLAPAPGWAPGDSCCWRLQMGRTYDTSTGPPRIRGAVYDFASPPRDSSFQLHLRVEDLESQDGAVVDDATHHLRRRGVVTPFELNLPALPLGRYGLRLEAEVAGRRASSTGQFEVGLAALSDLGAGEGGQELLRLLLSAAEADSLLQAAPQQQESLWESFWRRRDPDPTTAANETRDEMLQRVQYANAHFGASRRGWRSDRGRVYILQGPPDRVDRLANAEGRDRIERWTYAANRWVFVFLDPDGRGDYRLLRTNAPEF